MAKLTTFDEVRKAELRVLGDTQLVIDGEAVGLSAGKAALLSALALHAPQPLGMNDLASLLWEEPPSSYRKAVQNQVRRIRADIAGDLIETVGTSYRLGDSVDVVDLRELDNLEVTMSVDELERRLAPWRGEPFLDLNPTPEVWARRDRLLSLRTQGLTALARQLVQRGENERAQALLASPALPNQVRALLTASSPNQRGDEPPPRITPSSSQERAVEELLGHIGNARRSGMSQAIVVSGPAGAGKSTLLSALADRLPIELLVLRSTCQAAPAQAHAVFKTLMLDIPDTVEIDAATSVVDQLVSAIEDSPHEIVIILDDLQWATFGLLSFIEQLAAAARPVTLLVGTRERDGAEDILTQWPTTSMVAPALEIEAVQTLLEQTLRDQETDASELALDLHFLTNGAPLFTNQLVHELAAQHALEIRDGAWGLRDDHRIPNSLKDAVTRQLASLSMRSRLLLEFIATLHLVGGESTTTAVQEQSPAVIAEVQRSGLASQQADSWQMHAEVARSIYEQLPSGNQADLHLNAVALLSGSTPIAAARHVVLSLDHKTKAGLDLLLAAAEYATAEADWPVAVEMWDELIDVAVAISAPAESILDWSISHTNAARIAGDPRQLELMNNLMSLVEEVEDAARWAAAAIAICTFGATSDLGPSPEYVAFTDKALQLDLSAADRARLLGATTDLHGLGGDQQLLKQRFDEAYQLARALDDDAVMCTVLQAAYISVVDPSDLERRTDLGIELMELAASTGRTRAESEAHHLLFSCALIRGDKHLVDHHFLADAMIVPSRHDADVRWRHEYMRASRLHLLGQLAEAEASAARCLDFGTALGAERAFSVYGALIVGIRYDQGRLGELRPIVETLHSEEPERGAWIAVSALLDADGNRMAAAAAHLQSLADFEFRQLTVDPTYTASLWVAAEACAQVQDRSTAELLLPILEPLAGRMAWTGVSSPGPMDLPFARLLSLVGRRDEAQRTLDAAISKFGHQGWPVVLLRLQLARCALSIDEPDSQQLVRSVYAQATQLDLGGIAAKARDLRGG